MLNRLRKIDPEVYEAVRNEVRRQQVSPPAETGGIRLGTPAVTTRGMGPEEMDLIAELIDRVLSSPDDRRVRKYVREQTLDLCDTFPIYSGLLRRLYEQDRDAYEVDAGQHVSNRRSARACGGDEEVVR